MQTITIEQIRLDGGTQPRAGIDEATVAEYAAQMEAGDLFPPLIVFHDGSSYWLADGFHRVAAWWRVGHETMPADVRQGTQRDAILYAVGANASHGLRRSNDDKRRAVLRLLEDEEWGQWSDREIARRTHTSHTFVAGLRATLTGNVASERTYTTRHGTTAVMDTANIGGNAGNNNAEDAFPENPAQVAYEWLRDYVGDDGRTWRDLTEAQTWHGNSPCWQAFVAANPTLSRGYLKDARRRLEKERAPIWQLEGQVRSWLAFRTGNKNMQAHYDVLAAIKAGRGLDWEQSLLPWMRKRFASFLVGDLRQACNNVHEQLRQQLQQQSEPEPVPEPATPLSPLEGPIAISREQLANIYATYSGDKLQSCRIKGAVTFEDRLYVCTGALSHGRIILSADCCRLIPANAFQGETAESYGQILEEINAGTRSRDEFYYGFCVAYKGNNYVLAENVRFVPREAPPTPGDSDASLSSCIGPSAYWGLMFPDGIPPGHRLTPEQSAEAIQWLLWEVHWLEANVPPDGAVAGKLEGAGIALEQAHTACLALESVPA